MPHYCSIPNCINRRGLRFSIDEGMRWKWIVTVQHVKDERTTNLWLPGPHSVVCRAHFREDDHNSSLLSTINIWLRLNIIQQYYPQL